MNSLFKRLSLYRLWSRTLKKNSVELEKKFGLRVDRANRIYTVINIPQEIIGDAYNLKKNDIDKISEGYIREFSIEVSKFLDLKGLKEMYDFYDVQKVDKYSYLLIFGPHKNYLFDSVKFTRNLYYITIPILVGILLIFSLIYFL